MQHNQLNGENIENIQQRNKIQNNENESSFIPSAMASSVGNFVMNCLFVIFFLPFLKNIFNIR